MKSINENQKKLLELTGNSEKLIFAAEILGVSANLAGKFSIEKNNNNEDQLNVGDGTNQVHIDWSIVDLTVLCKVFS